MHRLWHESRVQAVLLGQRLDCELKGHDVVGGGQSIGILEIDLVLSRGNFMMTGFDFKAHLFQGHADFTACALAVVERPEVEIARFVAGRCSWMTFFICLEKEEFHFRADIEGVSHIRCFL